MKLRKGKCMLKTEQKNQSQVSNPMLWMSKWNKDKNIFSPTNLSSC